ncbi:MULTISPECIES: hypothetical protein [Streptomyces]|uniref:Secreted protein n=1 Tax=Streptomyces solicathayae TaxID=3081768 RepID=A0ABZ0LZ26_9ACTN|nr:hypothetical protein [Streptomyces sp. HUAS YS2]WOX24426.1 hypothetical protein R2D22_24815 [Streptomyces sp. HUAS YS2]
MATAITIMALLLLAFVALGVYATVRVARAAARGVDRTIDQAKRTVEDTALRARSYGQGGVAGELAQLRLSLRTSMRATQAALEHGAVEDASLRESLDLFKRLSTHGRELDEDLKRLEREPDRAGVAAQLPGLRERTEQITKSAESLRWAARDRARKFADDDLASLSAEIDMEAGALRHWSDPEPEAEPVPASGTASWPKAGAAAPEAEQGQTWPGEAEPAAEPGADEPQQPRQLPASDPRRTAYPWEKSARPETTN